MTDPTQGELSFELLAEIAVGATARVELCRVIAGPLDGELVAVKRLHPHIAEDPQFVDMFRDEVWMTAALKHTHVVEVVGWGQDEVGPWLAVELVRGVSLQRLMKTVFETGERFTERMVVYLARCICDGLAEAHSLRSASGEHLDLVHRDLTPGNILLGFQGQVKITDFGLAKAKQRLTKTLTGLLKGQPQYMSPEQVRGESVDARSDLFALGVVLFELFSGKRPWAATTDLDVMRAITDERPADLRKLRPRIDNALAEVVSLCLQKKPEQRPQGAVELRERFDGWLNAHGYREDNDTSLARFVRRNAMRQMRWFERAVAGELADEAGTGQRLPGGRVSTLPAPPMAKVAAATPATGAAPRSGRAAPKSSGEVTRHDGPIAAPLPPPRAEAPTRMAVDPDESGESGAPDADSIDWGDDGPTLVQRSELPRSTRGRPRLRDSLTGEPTTRRRRRARIPDRLLPSRPGEDGAAARHPESSELPTSPNRRALVGRVPAHASLAAVEQTAQLDTVQEVPSAKPSGPGLGVVAPPDPEVPPLPPDGDRAVPPAGRQVVDDTSTTRPLLIEELGIDSGSADNLAAAPQMTSTPAVAGMAPLPTPRFPSLPSVDEESRSSDFGGEALRLADASRRAADVAQAAERAADLASEAARLVARGETAEASDLLREAQQIDEALQRGDVPAVSPVQLRASSVQGLMRSFGLKARTDKRWLVSQRIATVVVATAVALLLVALLLALVL